MKLHLLPAIALVAAIPLVAMADGRREPPMPAEMEGQINVLPIGVESGEPRSAISLRESLRQPFDDASDDHPFRLNALERQRMRDQLRTQPFKSAAKQ